MPQQNVIYRQREAGGPLTDLSDYRRAGGYEALRTVLAEMDRDEVVYAFVRSGLRGRGGAGFPMGRKASFIPKDSALPAYVVCNADESEPGTFKDRELMETNPFQLLEGITIAGYAIGAMRGYIYIRGEYEHQARVLDAAIAQARAAGFLGTGRRRLGVRLRHHALPRRGRLHLRRGDGAAGEPRGQARPAAPEAPLPGRRRPLRLADADQQRRDALGPAADHREGPGLVRRDGHREEHRHQGVLDLGPRDEAGQLRDRHERHDAARAGLRHRGRVPPGPRLRRRLGRRVERQRGRPRGPRHPARLRGARRRRQLPRARPAAS